MSTIVHTHPNLSVNTDVNIECNDEGEVLIRTIVKIGDEEGVEETYSLLRDLIESIIEQCRTARHEGADRSSVVSELSRFASELDDLASKLYDEIDYL